MADQALFFPQTMDWLHSLIPAGSHLLPILIDAAMFLFLELVCVQVLLYTWISLEAFNFSSAQKILLKGISNFGDLLESPANQISCAGRIQSQITCKTFRCVHFWGDVYSKPNYIRLCTHPCMVWEPNEQKMLEFNLETLPILNCNPDLRKETSLQFLWNWGKKSVPRFLLRSPFDLVINSFSEVHSLCFTFWPLNDHGSPFHKQCIWRKLETDNRRQEWKPAQ